MICKCGVPLSVRIEPMGHTADGTHRRLVDVTHPAPLCDAWTKQEVFTVVVLPWVQNEAAAAPTAPEVA